MLYVAVATRAFRRYATYRGHPGRRVHQHASSASSSATPTSPSGTQRPDPGGYDVTDALTYVWLGQALLVTVALFGGGSTTSSPSGSAPATSRSTSTARSTCSAGGWPPTSAGRRSICSGAASCRWWSARCCSTCAARRPADLAGVPGLACCSRCVVSFAIRTWSRSAAFWLLDGHGRCSRWRRCCAMFFSRACRCRWSLFPGWLGDLALALPWASFLQVPADVFWASAPASRLLAGARPSRRSGRSCCWPAGPASSGWRRRKVVVQGG